MNNQSSLPDPWVAKIFQKLTLVYGRDFLGRYEGQKIEDVMTDWGHELRGFQQAPSAIKHGLETLDPGTPPTVLQFRNACRKAPQYAVKELPAPPADPAVVAAVTGGLKKIGGVDPKAWAHRLAQRERDGYRLTIAQKTMLREALRSDAGGAIAEAAELHQAQEAVLR